MEYTLQNKLGAWAMISLLMLATLPMMATTGCTSTQISKVITIIETDLPTAITDITSLLALIQDLSAQAKATGSSTLTTVITVLQTKAIDATTVLANYKAGTGTWANVVAAVDALDAAAAATIDLSGITDTVKAAKAKTLLDAVALAINVIYTAVLTTESTSTVKAKLAANKTLHSRLMNMTPEQQTRFVEKLKPVTGIGSVQGYELALS
jgi:hypothetical protein